MAPHASIRLSHLQPIRHSSKSGRSETKTNRSNHNPTNQTQHHKAPVFPGFVAEEFVTGAGGW